MNYHAKYIISLIILVVGCVLAVDGSNQIRGSSGVQEVMMVGAWKLGIGVVLVAIGAPLFYYYRQRKKQKQNSVEYAEIAMLATLGEQRLKEQEKEEKGHK